MRKSLKTVLALCGVAVGLGTAFAVRAQLVKTAVAPVARPDSVAAVDARWQASFDAFAAADRLAPPTPGGVVFVGSSSIRLWDDLEQRFAGPTAVIKRGFGGSRLADCAEHLQRLVVPYAPRLVVVYAGDNDLAEGRTPEQVLASFRAFSEGVHAALPDTRIAYVSIKPSPSREALMPLARETNALIAAYAAGRPGLDYIDVYSRMLGADGRPRAELFLPDALHLNAAGYAVWHEAISAHLR